MDRSVADLFRDRVNQASKNDPFALLYVYRLERFKELIERSEKDLNNEGIHVLYRVARGAYSTLVTLIGKDLTQEVSDQIQRDIQDKRLDIWNKRQDTNQT